MERPDLIDFNQRRAGLFLFLMKRYHMPWVSKDKKFYRDILLEKGDKINF